MVYKEYIVSWVYDDESRTDTLTINANGTYGWKAQHPRLWEWHRTQWIEGGSKIMQKSHSHMVPCFKDFFEELDRIDKILLGAE